ncbi:MAG: O-antigen ligase family protein [Nitrospirae bacterium]|nr:O-antigen ligase family protein [Nitrospirota bacterium]
MELLKSTERLMFLSLCGLFFLIPVATSPSVIVGLTTLAIWVFSGKFIKNRSWLKQRWSLPVIAMMLLPWVGLLWTEDVTTGLSFARKSHYWLFAFAIASLSFSSLRVDALMKAYIGGVSFTALLFLMQLAGAIPMRPPYSVGLLNKWAHISFSLLLTFSVLLLSFYFKEAKQKRDKVICLCLMLLNFLALSMLFSDSGHLAFILLSPLVAYNILSKRHLLNVLIVSALMTGALFLSPVTQNRLIEAVTGTITYTESTDLTPIGGRYYMWTGALKIYLKNPVFGIGTGGYQSEIRKLRINGQLAEKIITEDPIQPHNSFLYMAVSFGIPGIITLVWLFALLIKSGWQNRSSLTGFSILAFTLTLLIGSLTDTQILQVHTGMLFALFTGLSGTSDERV